MTPRQIANLLTEDLHPGELGICEEGQYVVTYWKPLDYSKMGERDDPELTHRAEKGQVVADLVEKDTDARLFLIGIGATAPGGARSNSLEKATFKSKHPNFWIVDSTAYEQYQLTVTPKVIELLPRALQTITRQDQGLEQTPAPEPEFGAEDELPSEAEFVRQTYGREQTVAFRARMLVAQQLGISIEQVTHGPFRFEFHNKFDRILTINYENIISIARAGQALYQGPEGSQPMGMRNEQDAFVDAINNDWHAQADLGA